MITGSLYENYGLDPALLSIAALFGASAGIFVLLPLTGRAQQSSSALVSTAVTRAPMDNQHLVPLPSHHKSGPSSN